MMRNIVSTPIHASLTNRVLEEYFPTRAEDAVPPSLEFLETSWKDGFDEVGFPYQGNGGWNMGAIPFLAGDVRDVFPLTSG
jgi:hypothetical protein